MSTPEWLKNVQSTAYWLNHKHNVHKIQLHAAAHINLKLKDNQ